MYKVVLNILPYFLFIIESSGPEVIKLFSCSTQLSITAHNNKNEEKYRHKFSCFHTLIYCIYNANKWHFNINEHDKFHAQLS